MRTLLVPIAVSAVALLALAGFRRTHESVGRWAGGVVVALGTAASASAWHGTPSLFPVDATGWLPHLAILGGGAALVASVRGADERPWQPWSARALIATFSSWVLLSAAREYQWRGGTGALWSIAFVFGLVAFLGLLDNAARKQDDRVILFGVGLTAAASAGVLVLSGMLRGGLLGGGLAATVGVAFIGSASGRMQARAAVAVAGLLMWSLWSIAFLYAEMPRSALVLLALTPAALVAANAVASPRLRPIASLAVRAAVLIALLAGAVGSTARQYFSDDDNSSGSDQEYDYGYDYAYDDGCDDE